MTEADASRMMPLGRRPRATRARELPRPRRGVKPVLTRLAQFASRCGSRLQTRSDWILITSISTLSLTIVLFRGTVPCVMRRFGIAANGAATLPDIAGTDNQGENT